MNFLLVFRFGLGLLLLLTENEKEGDRDRSLERLFAQVDTEPELEPLLTYINTSNTLLDSIRSK
jgi:hypothetical protein